MRVYEFFTAIRKTVLVDANNYVEGTKGLFGKSMEELLELQKELEQNNPNNIYRFKIEQIKLRLEIDKPYTMKSRGYGQGNVRIGQCVDMDDSIYSLGFISQINNDIMESNFDIVKGKFRGAASGKVEVEKIEISAVVVIKPETKLVGDDYGEEIDEVEVEDKFAQEILDKKKFNYQLRVFEIRKQKRINIFVHVVLTFLLQFTLIIMTFFELTGNCIYYEVIMQQVNIPIMFARFICATILHLSLVDEVSHGLEMMKFCANHPYKFNSFVIAWIAGFLQTMSCLTCEIANIGVLCGANDTISIVFNFIALAIIAEFDNFVFSSMKTEFMTMLIERDFTKQCLMYSHTTSSKCAESELSD